MRMNHSAIVCSTPETADRFYEGVLGLKKVKSFLLKRELSEQIFGTARECQVIHYSGDTLSFEVFLDISPRKDTHPYMHVCLEVDDRETFLAKCKSKGVVVNRVQKGDSMLAFIADYDGNLFEIKESAPSQ